MTEDRTVHAAPSGPFPGDMDADATIDPDGALGPALGPQGPASPFYVKEWHGMSLYACPAGDFHGRSHAAIIRHVQEVHVEPERTIEQRAQSAGIILAKR